MGGPVSQEGEGQRPQGHAAPEGAAKQVQGFLMTSDRRTPAGPVQGRGGSREATVPPPQARDSVRCSCGRHLGGAGAADCPPLTGAAQRGGARPPPGLPPCPAGARAPGFLRAAVHPTLPALPGTQPPLAAPPGSPLRLCPGPCTEQNRGAAPRGAPSRSRI